VSLGLSLGASLFKVRSSKRQSPDLPPSPRGWWVFSPVWPILSREPIILVFYDMIKGFPISRAWPRVSSCVHWSLMAFVTFLRTVRNRQSEGSKSIGGCASIHRGVPRLEGYYRFTGVISMYTQQYTQKSELHLDVKLAIFESTVCW